MGSPFNEASGKPPLAAPCPPGFFGTQLMPQLQHLSCLPAPIPRPGAGGCICSLLYSQGRETCSPLALVKLGWVQHYTAFWGLSTGVELCTGCTWRDCFSFAAFLQGSDAHPQALSL